MKTFYSYVYNGSNPKPDLQLFADDIILDMTTIALLIWVLWNKFCCCKSTETENLNDEDENLPKYTLTHLVDAVRYSYTSK